MKKRKKKFDTEIEIPQGYEIEKLLDTDDTGYGYGEGEAIIKEEVKLKFERKSDKPRDIR